MRVRRLPLIDTFEEGEQIAVFVGDQVMVLSIVATATLLAVGYEWTEIREMSTRLEATIGPPPGGDTETSLRIILAELARRDLVELSTPTV